MDLFKGPASRQQHFVLARSFLIAAITIAEIMHTSALEPEPVLTMVLTVVPASSYRHPFSCHPCPAFSFLPLDAPASVSAFPSHSAPPSASLAAASDVATTSASIGGQPAITIQTITQQASALA